MCKVYGLDVDYLRGVMLSKLDFVVFLLFNKDILHQTLYSGNLIILLIEIKTGQELDFAVF